MNLPPQMVDLFLRSAGAPAPVIDLVKRIQAMGFNAFAIRDAAEEDANWAKFGEAKGKRTGFYLVANSADSRALVGVFLEGVNDEILEGLNSLGRDAAAELPQST